MPVSNPVLKKRVSFNDELEVFQLPDTPTSEISQWMSADEISPLSYEEWGQLMLLRIESRQLQACAQQQELSWADQFLNMDAFMEIEVGGEKRWMQPSTGIFPGTSVATDIFDNTYYASINQ